MAISQAVHDAIYKNKKISIRTLVQIFFFALIGYYAIGKSLSELYPSLTFLPSLSLHSICPFGGVVTLYSLLTDGSYIQKIHASAVVLLGLVVGLSVIAGPVFCGWVCPLGSIQDWVGKIGRKIFRRRYNHFIPSRLDAILRYFRYVVLALVVYVTAVSGKLLFQNLDPYYALFNFWTSEVSVIAVSILLVTLVLSLFVARPWCKYACPYGAFLGLFNKIRLFTIRREAGTCISCNRCNRECPMNINVAGKRTIRDSQCISCLECTSDRSCPVSDTVHLELALIPGANSDQSE